MKRILFALTLSCAAVTTGCGEPVAKYDPVRDQSTISKTITPLKLSDRQDVRSILMVLLSGEGKYPKSWSCQLSVHIDGPKNTPDLLSERPQFVFASGSQDAVFDVTVEGLMVPTNAGAASRSDLAFFNVSIDNLIKLAESGRFKLDGKSFSLNDAEKEVVRSAIVAARETTNAGR
jgi:hypothetical protein